MSIIWLTVNGFVIVFIAIFDNDMIFNIDKKAFDWSSYTLPTFF